LKEAPCCVLCLDRPRKKESSTNKFETPSLPPSPPPLPRNPYPTPTVMRHQTRNCEQTNYKLTASLPLS